MLAAAQELEAIKEAAEKEEAADESTTAKNESSSSVSPEIEVKDIKNKAKENN